MNLSRLVVVVFAVVLTAVLMSTQRRSPPPPAKGAIDVPVGGPYHGVALQVHGFGENLASAEQAIREIAALGADTVLLSAAAYQTHAAANDLTLDQRRGGRPEEWARLFGTARQVGLRIVLMPIVLLDHPRGNEWRGVIRPNDWNVWFDRYEQIMLHFARLAARHDIEILIIGSELVSTEAHTDRWRRLIRAVREIYRPPGKLAYSANWDHYRNIEFWSDVDLIGMTTYYKLSSKPGPTLDTLMDAWKPIQDDILSWQRTIGKPILFTEVGWCSQEGCSVEAWNYYRHDQSSPAGLQEQRRCYQAFMRTWRDTPGVGGVIWWEWNAGSVGPTDHGYCPKGKPAEPLLREWFARHQRERDQREAREASREAPQLLDEIGSESAQ